MMMFVKFDADGTVVVVGGGGCGGGDDNDDDDNDDNANNHYIWNEIRQRPKWNDALTM